MYYGGKAPLFRHLWIGGFVKLKAQTIYDIDMDPDNKNGYHIYSREQGHGIYMCPIGIWKHHSNFNEFVEYYIHWQLCERICLESRIHKIKSKYRCNSAKYCPMEVPALLMLGTFINHEYYLFSPLNYEMEA